MFWAGVMAFGYPGVMSAYWQEAFGVSAAQTGLVVTLQLVSLAVGMFFSGALHARVGTRVCFALGTLFECAGFALLLVDGLGIASAYAWALVSNVGNSLIFGPATTTGQAWLPHRRGLASGITTFAFGVSAAVVVPFLEYLLNTAGAAATVWFMIGAIVVCGVAAVALAEMPGRTHLSAEEQRAYQAWVSRGAHGAGGANLAANTTVAQAVRTRGFWLLWTVWVLVGAAGISMISLEKGFALAQGLNVVAVVTAFNLGNGFVRIAAGVLTDRIGAEPTGCLTFAAAGAGYALLVAAGGLAPCAVAGAFLVGCGLGGLFTVSPPIVSGLFGLKNFGKVYGVVFTGYGLVGGLVGPALAGVVLDVTGGAYAAVFAYLGAFAFAGAALVLVLRRAGRR